MSDSFEGRYMLVGPKVYITPDSTIVFDDHKRKTLLNELPAGVWIWVECDERDCAVPSHWVDIMTLVEGYTESLAHGLRAADCDTTETRYDRDTYPR